MLAFPSMITDAALSAGMKTPELDENDEFDAEQYPHFHVYCNVQLGCPVTWGNHWENAKIIAAIPEEQLKTLTYQELVDKGFSP